MKRILSGVLAALLLAVAPAHAADVKPLVNASGQVRPMHTGETVGVPNGGTGAVSFTAHCVILGGGTLAFHTACPSSAGQVLTDNGASSDPTFQSGGSGSPGGSSGQIQYNNSGAFGGFTASGDATINTSTGAISVVQAPKWTTGRTLSITGDLAYTSPSFDGSGNVTAAGTLATVNSNVGSFTNANITVNAKGLITAASTGSGGSGTVTTTGSPASGNLSKFSGASSITNGDLSGDCTTSGALATTCTKTSGVAFAASATTDTTNATNITSGTLASGRMALATSSAPGAVQPDNATTTVSGGVISAVAGGTIASTASLDVLFFGDGSDSDVTVTTSITLTRDMYYHNLTISGSGTIATAGYKIHCSGTLDISAAGANAIQDNGTAGANSATTAGGGLGGAVPNNTIGGSAAATAGAGGTTGAGSQGGIRTAITVVGGLSGASGAGGASGTGNGGGSARSASAVTNFLDVRQLQSDFAGWISGSTYTQIQGGGSGPGGGSGGGDGSGSGGGGGGGGSAGGVVYLAAKTINRGGSTTAGALAAKGGAGGNGGPGSGGTNRGGGGGGAAGGGGWFILVYRTLTGSTATNAIDLTGGTGGAGGNGTGSGSGGDGGGGGGGGRLDVYDLGSGTQTINATVAATTGNAHSTGTGGGVKAATAQQFSL